MISSRQLKKGSQGNQVNDSIIIEEFFFFAFKLSIQVAIVILSDSFNRLLSNNNENSEGRKSSQVVCSTLILRLLLARSIILK